MLVCKIILCAFKSTFLGKCLKLLTELCQRFRDLDAQWASLYFEGHILLHRVHKLLFHGIQCTTNHHIAVLLGAQNLSHNVFKGAYVLLRWAKSHSVVSFLALAWKAGLVLAHCMHLSCAHKLIKQWKGIHGNLHADESACVWDHSFPYNILI